MGQDFFIGPVVLLIPLLIGLLSFILWLWMLVDCLANEPSEGNDKMIWALLIVLLLPLGAVLYLLVRRPQRIERHGR